MGIRGSMKERLRLCNALSVKPSCSNACQRVDVLTAASKCAPSACSMIFTATVVAFQRPAGKHVAPHMNSLPHWHPSSAQHWLCRLQDEGACTTAHELSSCWPTTMMPRSSLSKEHVGDPCFRQRPPSFTHRDTRAHMSPSPAGVQSSTPAVQQYPTWSSGEMRYWHTSPQPTASRHHCQAHCPHSPHCCRSPLCAAPPCCCCRFLQSLHAHQHHLSHGCCWAPQQAA